MSAEASVWAGVSLSTLCAAAACFCPPWRVSYRDAVAADRPSRSASSLDAIIPWIDSSMCLMPSSHSPSRGVSACMDGVLGAWLGIGISAGKIRSPRNSHGSSQYRKSDVKLAMFDTTRL